MVRQIFHDGRPNDIGFGGELFRLHQFFQLAINIFGEANGQDFGAFCFFGHGDHAF